MSPALVKILIARPSLAYTEAKLILLQIWSRQSQNPLLGIRRPPNLRAASEFRILDCGLRIPDLGSWIPECRGPLGGCGPLQLGGLARRANSLKRGRRARQARVSRHNS